MYHQMIITKINILGNYTVSERPLAPLLPLMFHPFVQHHYPVESKPSFQWFRFAGTDSYFADFWESFQSQHKASNQVLCKK
ncbi:hypothetical protein EL17_18195 [Anditalea andensis]|uniref:Uncharacterized protein n=1 Tax=Anditalea andensis TaxID=1048983 RepID=A0A074KUW0_9BACT|nr:hypothetical protein EL17_18195 [Anditalea andensis]